MNHNVTGCILKRLESTRLVEEMRYVNLLSVFWYSEYCSRLKENLGFRFVNEGLRVSFEDT